MAKRIPPETTTTQLAELAGVTLRQLQCWDEMAIICPMRRLGPGGGSGMQRFYSQEEVRQVCAIAELRRRRIPLKNAWAVARKRPDETAAIVSAIDLLRKAGLKVG